MLTRCWLGGIAGVISAKSPGIRGLTHFLPSRVSAFYPIRRLEKTHPRHTIKTLMSGSSPLFDISIAVSGGVLRAVIALFRGLYRSFPAPSRQEDFKRDTLWIVGRSES